MNHGGSKSFRHIAPAIRPTSPTRKVHPQTQPLRFLHCKSEHLHPARREKRYEPVFVSANTIDRADLHPAKTRVPKLRQHGCQVCPVHRIPQPPPSSPGALFARDRPPAKGIGQFAVVLGDGFTGSSTRHNGGRSTQYHSEKDGAYPADHAPV